MKAVVRVSVVVVVMMMMMMGMVFLVEVRIF